MPSKLDFPSASVFSSMPPLPCFPFPPTGGMMPLALRTGFPLSSFSTWKFKRDVGPSSSCCAAATGAIASVASTTPAATIPAAQVFLMGAFYAGGPVLSSGSGIGGIGGIGGGEEPVEPPSAGQPRVAAPLRLSAETRNGTTRGRDLGSTRRPQTHRNIFLERVVLLSLVSSRRIIFPK